jgi:hypothetical protein
MDADTFIPTTINDLFDRWRTHRTRGTRRGYTGVVTHPATVAVDTAVLHGKEGDHLLEIQRGLIAPADAVTIYKQPTIADPEWEHIDAVLNALGTREVARRFPTIPARTLRYLLGGRPPNRPTRREIAEQLLAEATRALAHARRPVPGDRISILAAYALLLHEHAARRCEVDGTPLTARQERFCSDRCRQRARRANARRAPSPPRPASANGEPRLATTEDANARETATPERLYKRITNAIQTLGWAKAKRIVKDYVGTATGGMHGTWRRLVSVDLLEELERSAATATQAAATQRQTEQEPLFPPRQTENRGPQ